MNPTPQPVSEDTKIIEEINRLKETWDFTDFQLKRLKKRAEDVRNNVDLGIGFALLGMIAELEGDVNAMHSYFKRALQQSCESPEHLCNYASALLSEHIYEDAYRYALGAYEKNPKEKFFLDILIKVVVAMNRTEDFEKYTKIWRELTGKDHISMTAPFYYSVNHKAVCAFKIRRPETKEIFNLCDAALIRFFSMPLNVKLEIMPDACHKDNLVAWIQWFGEMEDGMERYDRFEDWYIENGYDLKSDLLNFNIEFAGA